MPVVFDGFVLEPDGAPAAGAVVVSSAGGKAGHGGSTSLMTSTKIGLSVSPGSTLVDPLVLALGSGCDARWLPTFGGHPGVVGQEGSVHALAVFDDGSGPALYAGGNFYSVYGGTAVGKWDGTSWLELGTMNGPVKALAVFDDGGGPGLYAGGDFTTADSLTVNGIAKLDGASWSALGSGVSIHGDGDSGVEVLEVLDDGTLPVLHIGGAFVSAPDSGDSCLAKWGRPGPCVLQSKVRRR